MVQGTKATLKAEALETEMKSQVLSYLSSLSISDLNNINLTKWNSKEFVSLNLVENVKKKNFGNAWKELKLYSTVFRNKLVFSCILTVYFPISNNQYILEQNNSVLNACYLFSCMKIIFCLWNWLQAKKQRALKRQLSIIQACKSFTKLPGSRKKTLRMSLRSRLREKLSMRAFAKNPKCK